MNPNAPNPRGFIHGQDAVARQQTTEARHFQGAHDGLLRIDSFLPATADGHCPGDPGVLGCGMGQF